MAAIAAWIASTPAWAESGIDLFSPETFVLAGDVRAVAVEGESSWVDGGFGKLRFGGGGENARSNRIGPIALGSADVVWQPRLGWSLSATVVGSVQQRGHVEAGLSEAYLSLKPLTDAPVKFTARAGLMWPPVSLEHAGPEWAVRDTITPSAINSWIGEEVKFVGAEGLVTTALAGGKVSFGAAIVDVNDTAGALLTYRGWALHDVKTLAWRKQPLPPLSDGIEPYQPHYTHPLKDMDHGFLKRPGWYARAVLQLAAPFRIEAIHYDNGGDPDAANSYREWGWRTRFENLGLIAQIRPGTELRAQAMRGHTVMGFYEGERRLVDTRFRSAYALLTQRLGERVSISARAEFFATRNHGTDVTSDDDEHGWALTAAGKRSISRDLTILVEALHVDSRRASRARLALNPRQGQTQLQGSLQFRW